MRLMRESLLLFLFIACTVFAQQNKLSGRLERALNQTESNEYVRSLVILNDQVDVANMDARFYAEKATLERRTYEVITALQKKADQTQPELLSYLSRMEATEAVFTYRKFWIVNAIMVEAKPEVILNLATRRDVHMIDLDARLERDKPVSIKRDDPAQEAINSVEPGLKIINADKLWAMGITGQGRIVMGIDTGVDPTHPALSYKWRGTHVSADQAWFDPTGGSSSPEDCDGHGTHTMGTMTGYVEGGDTVGVAIGAEWIASNSLCGGSPHTSNSIASFEWAMNPDQDVNTIDDMPDAINNSWYDPSISDECDNVWVDCFNAVEATGIAVVFSAGNSGPNSQTITTPKNINTNTTNVWATAAINGANYLNGSNDPIASFSSRGPSVCDGEGPLKIKPEASAPGDDVRSSYPGGGYSLLSGTSMAAPHVTGAIALLRQFAPTLTGKQIKEALYATAKDLGTEGEDNTYGVGLIDLYAAFLSLGTPDETPPETIVDLAVSDITSSELTITWTVPVDTSANGVTGFDIRMSTSPINDTTDFYNAEQVPFTKLPNQAGETETIMIENLDFSTEYYFAIISSDIWSNHSELSNLVSGTTYDAPVVQVTPDELGHFLPAMSTLTDTVKIANVSATNSTLDFSVSLENNTFPEDAVQVKLVPKTLAIESEGGSKDKPVEKGGLSLEGFGGPDMFGYEWIDSDETNGPNYEWNDISTTGTLVDNWQATGTYDPLDEGIAGPFDLGFTFKFYDTEYSEVYLNTNGFVAFESFSGSLFSNKEIPNTDAPNAIIAAVWDDLDGDGGNCYVQQFSDKFVIQYDNWPEYSASGTFTFQIVIFRSGKVIIYYNSLTGDLTSATVGIESPDGTDGLQVEYNGGTYLANNKALQFASEPGWLTNDVSNGRLFNGNEVDIELTFHSEDFPGGLYSMDVVVASNDPNTPSVTVPVQMVLGEGDGPWNTTLSVADAAGTEAGMDLVFGQAGDATDGIDDGYNEYALPPVPPTGVFDARFLLPTEDASYTDIRSFLSDSLVWNLKLQPSEAGYPFTLRWDAATLPNGIFMLTDALGVVYNVDMKRQDSLVVDNSAVNSLNITFTKEMTVAMDITEGWNLMSVPMHMDDMSAATLFPEAALVYGFDDGYDLVSELMMGKGYWLKADAAAHHEMTGEPEMHAVPVAAGWNIIGSGYEAVPIENITSDANVSVTSQYFGFNNGYSAATEILPGEGYWVKVSDAGNLYFGAVAAKASNSVKSANSENFNTITLNDADGNYRQLYLAENLSGKSYYDMPPVAPGNIFDARFSSNSMAEDLAASNEIVLSGGKYPVILTSNDLDLTIQLSNGSDVITKSVAKGSSLTISDSKYSRIVIMSEFVPNEFSLYQNYPNPFNPSTTIKFALPVEAKVTITLYNALGQRVDMIESNNFAAGVQSVNFNASALASGMYIYHISAQGVDGSNFVDTKKMMLMK